MSPQTEQLLSRTGDIALRRRAFWVLKKIQLPPKKANILDAGCGDGFYLYLLSELFPSASLIGLDCNRLALKSARGNLRGKEIKLLLGDIIKIPLKDNQFDVVLASEVLEHLNDDYLAVKELVRVLKPGGQLLITVPHANFPFLWDPINWLSEACFGFHFSKGFWAGIWNQHLRLYTTQQLLKLLKKGRLKDIKLSVATKYCLPFNHYLLNLGARFLVRNKKSKKLKSIDKFNGKSTFKTSFINPFWFIFQFDNLNNLNSGNKVGVSLMAEATK